jgi:hypothetical protein
MEKSLDKSNTSRPKVNVTEHNLLVAHGQSKKLADIRKRLQPESPVAAPPLPDKQLLAGLKPEVATELTKARQLIDDSINRIMKSFPEGKKNRLFAFRFGSVEAVKTISIKAAFKALGIADHLVNMKLLADMDSYGHEVKDN